MGRTRRTRGAMLTADSGATPVDSTVGSLSVRPLPASPAQSRYGCLWFATAHSPAPADKENTG